MLFMFLTVNKREVKITKKNQIQPPRPSGTPPRGGRITLQVFEISLNKTVFSPPLGGDVSGADRGGCDISGGMSVKLTGGVLLPKLKLFWEAVSEAGRELFLLKQLKFY
jgi:hypothetical protein